MSRTSLETQKLDLMDEVSYLKLKLVSMEETNCNSQPQDAASKEQNKAEVWKGLIAWFLPIVKLLQAETAALFVWMKAFHSFYEKLNYKKKKLQFYWRKTSIQLNTIQHKGASRISNREQSSHILFAAREER